METQKVITLAFAVLLLNTLQAQSIIENRKGCINSQGNLAAGYLFAQKQVGAYFVGEAELFVDNRVSIAGATWLSFATTQKTKPGLRANHSILWGFNYHFLKKGRWDPYIGFTPGLGIVRTQYLNDEGVLTRSSFAPVPLVSASLGCNFYIGSIFHFFAKVQGVSGQMLKDVPAPVRLEEIKCTVGLGWNLRLWKPKTNSNI